MATPPFLALLRGINVGGRNLVAMADLRKAFEAGGYERVSTYIQSGNVLFESSASVAPSESDIETMLERQLGVPLVVVLRSHRQLGDVIGSAPAGFGQTPETHRSDVVFLKAPLSPAQAMRVIGVQDGVDEVWPGNGVLYTARLSERAGESRLSRMVGTPEYKRMTIRNWSTTTKLLTLLEG